ncbi:intermembrane phospholipid transport protein YdbH family protein [Aliikangiella coralliicola]|uniref:Dicarboxylate transport domain-containing protein n=1 Tax=Aliikangiella coralliicola TaxID=2592383 RepID=A0A545UID0_9GAMM|nr:YdbH domain-containing protein [Aliikangiella coralliicola]TQV89210.1 hypothetical protein FLL46_03525 [Aliikangiella coralliicola]
MVNRFKLVAVVLLFLILFSYATFPWWAANLAARFLPENMSLTNIEIGYPGLHGVSVNRVEIKVAQIDIQLTNFSLDYSLEKIKAEAISLQFLNENNEKASTPENQFKLDLPTIDFSSLYQQLKFSEVQIDQVKVIRQEKEINISDIKLKLEQAGKAEMAFQLVKGPLIAQTRNTRLLVNISEEKTTANLEVEGNKLLSMMYKIDSNRREVSLQLDVNRFYLVVKELIPPEMLKAYLKNIDEALVNEINIDGQVNIQLVQDDQLQKLHSELSYLGTLRSSPFTEQPVQLSVNSVSESNSFPFELNTKLRLSSDQSLNFKPNQMTIDKPDVSVETVVLIDAEHFQLIEPQIHTQFNEVDLPDNKLRVDQLVTRSQISTVDLNLFSLENIQVETKINNAIVNFRNAKSESEIVASISGKLELTSLDSGNISGTLAIKPIKTPQWMPSEDNQVSVALSGINQSLTNGKIKISMQDSFGEISDIPYQQASADLLLNIEEKVVAGNGEIKLNESIVSPFEVSLDRENGYLDVNLPKHDIDLELVNFLIQSLELSDLPEIAFESGELSHQGNFVQRENLLVDNRARLRGADIQFGKNTIVDVNLDAQLKSLDPVAASSQITGEKIVFASDLEMTDFNTRLLLDNNNRLNIQKLGLRLLGGTLSGEQIVIEGGQILPSEIKVKKMSLTELVFFTKMDALFAEGDIDLNIPVKNDGDKIVVENATFKSLNKGIIRYSTGTPLDESSNIALKALENFHFTELSGDFGYDKNEQYHIKIHLLGNNPDLYDGYPVDFVLNISGNLPGLFKSLFLTGSFEEAILNSVKTGSQ